MYGSCTYKYNMYLCIILNIIVDMYINTVLCMMYRYLYFGMSEKSVTVWLFKNSNVYTYSKKLEKEK